MNAIPLLSHLECTALLLICVNNPVERRRVANAAILNFPALMWDVGKEVQFLIIPVQKTYCLAAENGKTAKRPSFGAQKGIRQSAKSEDLYRLKAHFSSWDGVLSCTSR